MNNCSGYRLVVVEESAGSVGFYDPSSGMRTGKVDVGFLPHEITVSADGATGYVSNFGLQDYDETIGVPGYSISVIDLERCVETKRLYTFDEHGDVFQGPHGVKLRPGKAELFVNVEVGEQIIVFDLETGKLARRLEGVGGQQPVEHFSVPAGTHNFVFSADGAALYFFAGPAGVYKMDPDTGQFLEHYVSDSPIHGLEFTPDFTALIASGVNEIVMLDPADLSVRATFGNLGVQQILYSEPTHDGLRIVAPAVWDSQTLVVDATNGTVLARIVMGIDPVHVAISPDDHYAYVSNGRSKFVCEIDLSTYEMREIATGEGPNGLAIVPSAAAVERKTLQFGAVLPLSGALAASGREVAAGYQYWMECVNGAGGIAVGDAVYEVALAVRDNGSDATKSTALTVELLDVAGVELMLGGYPTPSDAAVGPLLNERGMPMVGSGSAGDVVYGPGNQFVFGLLPPAAGYLTGSVDVSIAQSPAPKSFVILSSDDPAALEDALVNAAYATQKGLAQLTLSGALPAGIKKVDKGVLVYHEGLTDFKAALTSIAALRPDVFFATGHAPASLNIVQQAAALDFAPMGLAFAVGPAIPTFVQAAGPLAANLMGPGVWIPQNPTLGLDRFGTGVNFVSDYYARYNMQPSYLSAGAVACGLVYEDALRRANTIEPKAVRDALAKVNLMTFYGPVAFSARGINAAKQLLTFQIVSENGKLTNEILAPPALAPNAKAVWPFPGWAKQMKTMAAGA